MGNKERLRVDAEHDGNQNEKARVTLDSNVAEK